MSNLSILERNIIHAIDDDLAESAFLKAREFCGPLAAEAYALEYKAISNFLVPALLCAGGPHPTADLVDLEQFIMKRHWHHHFPEAKN